MGVPSPVTVRLRILSFAVTGRTVILLTIAGPFFPLLCSSADGSAITGKSQMLRNDQPLTDGRIEELLFIEPEDQRKWIVRFQLPAFQQGKELGSGAGRVTGSLIAFLFPLGGLVLGKRSLGERLFESSCHKREKKS